MESGRVTALSIHSNLFLFPSPRSLFRLPRFRTRPSCARPLSSLSLSRSLQFHRRNEQREGRFKLADPHEKVPLRVLFRTLLALPPSRNVLSRCATLTFQGRETSIRSCFSSGSFLHKFSVSLRTDLLSPFVLVLLRRLPQSKVETRRDGVLVCVGRARCVSRETASLMEVRCRCPVKFYNYKTVPRRVSPRSLSVSPLPFRGSVDDSTSCIPFSQFNLNKIGRAHV